ncbi:MAG: hypothetical protein GY943_35200 [Chloroflexi bacterium]|nr:hypothetical protein [Chloroflexota bacterium]
MDELLPRLKETLVPADLHAALERGKVLELDMVVGKLLEEFHEENRPDK